MALQTKTISDVAAKGHHKFTLTVTEDSTSTANNTSTISWKLVLSPIGAYDWYYQSTVPVTYKVTIAGTTYSGNIMSYNGTSTKTIRSGSKTVTHNADGDKTISYSFSVSSLNVYYLPGAASASGSMALTTIPRKATITSAPNFNDEGNPVIKYSNKAGSAVTSLQACISLTGAKADIAYRNVSKTGTSYTFNLTDAEREVLRKATTGSNSRSVRFYIQTVIGGETYRHYVSKTFTVINGTPTIAPTVTDTNASTVALTGDASKLIKYYSDVDVAINATAKKSATISSYKITNGSKSLTTSTGSFTDITDGNFVFSVTDNRKNTVSQTITKAVVEYLPLTCKIKADAMNALGELTFKVSGSFFNGSFGAAANALTLFYRMKENEGEYGEWIALTPSLSGNSYSATVNLTGLNYRNKYTVQAKAADSLEAKESSEVTIKSPPVFDWSQTDFNHNTDVTCREDVILDNAKYLRGRFKDEEGTEYSIAGINASNKLLLGYGMYNASVGSTVLCGNELELRTRDTYITTNKPVRGHAMNRMLTTTKTLTNSMAKLDMSTAGWSLGGNSAFTAYNGGIKCNFDGILLVTGAVHASGLTAGDSLQASFYNGSSAFASAYNGTSKTYATLTLPPRIISVSAGDVIYLYARNNTQAGGTCAAGGNTTLLCQYI